MKHEYLTRQWDILPPEKTKLKISVMGAGAIGSQVTMCLAKMGFENLMVFDFDTVDEENINNQWYGPEQIGQLKIEALNFNVGELVGDGITRSVEKGGSETQDYDEDVIISALDSMQARKNIYERAKGLYKCRWFIDPRMGAEVGAIYVVDLDSDESKANYELSLYTDEESVSEACTAKATMYCSMLLAAQVCKTVKDIAVGDEPMRKCFWDIRKNAVMFL